MLNPDRGSTPVLCGRPNSCAQKTSRRGEDVLFSANLVKKFGFVVIRGGEDVLSFSSLVL